MLLRLASCPWNNDCHIMHGPSIQTLRLILHQYIFNMSSISVDSVQDVLFVARLSEFSPIDQHRGMYATQGYLTILQSQVFVQSSLKHLSYKSSVSCGSHGATRTFSNWWRRACMQHNFSYNITELPVSLQELTVRYGAFNAFVAASVQTWLRSRLSLVSVNA